jgi:hypothetical protein
LRAEEYKLLEERKNYKQEDSVEKATEEGLEKKIFFLKSGRLKKFPFK